jgi:hypothetical protein
MHIVCIGEGIFVQRFSTVSSLFSPSFERGKIDMRAIGNRGNWDRRTMGRGIASWLQSAVGRQSQAIDTSAGN